MRVGFTGTRDGLGAAQGGALARWVRDHAITEFHQGCCPGADAEATMHVAHYHPRAVVHGHRSDLKGMTHPAAVAMSHVLYDPKPPLERNQDIVDATDVLLACPAGPEVTRSGTWSTIRRARRAGRRIVIVWPDGTVTEE